MVGDALLAAAGILHVTGHHLADGADAARDLAALVERAHAQGARVSISPGSAGVIADCGADRVARAIAGADLVFANLDEAVALAGPGEPAALAAALADRHGIAVLTRRSGDVLVAERGGAVGAVPVSAARVIDPTGAGDALIAGFLEAWRDDPDPARAAEAGVRRASEAVAVLGGRPMVPR